MMGARRAACVVAIAAGPLGCMTGAQTFEQDLAYQRFQRCSQWPTIVLQRINTDGRVIVMGRGTERYQFLACMAEQAREQQKSKPGLVVPDPIVNPIPR